MSPVGVDVTLKVGIEIVEGIGGSGDEWAVVMATRE